MLSSNTLNNIYYQLKPLIPRPLQIWLRRKVVLRKRKAYSDVWPILESAAEAPDGWASWPDQKRFAFVLIHDVDTASGQEKCLQLMKIEQALGFRSSFNFVPERYAVSEELRHHLASNGFEVGVHGLKHDGKLFSSRKVFQERAFKINKYLREWGSSGFTSPSMHHKLDWMHVLKIVYDISTFDTDPFEPQPDGVGTIFPFWVGDKNEHGGYVELPYTLPQDSTLFVIMKEKTPDIWKRKLDWIAENGGMVLLNSHPDYMNFNDTKMALEEYSSKHYQELLQYIKTRYKGRYWHVLPREIARFWRKTMVGAF